MPLEATNANVINPIPITGLRRFDMPGLHKVQLIGNLGRDRGVTTRPNGKKLSQFTLAVTRRWKSPAKTKKPRTGFNVEAWGRLGEISQQYLKKGSLVYIEGRLQTDRYEDKGGETKYSPRWSPVSCNPRPQAARASGRNRGRQRRCEYDAGGGRR